MQSAHHADRYKQLLTEIFQKQIIVLGPSITLTKVRKVKGLTIANDGTVIAITNDPQTITQELINQFSELSPLIVEKTMQPLLKGADVLSSPFAQTPLPAEALAKEERSSPTPEAQSHDEPVNNETI